MGKIIDGIKIGFWLCLVMWLFFVWLYFVKWTWENNLWSNPIDTSGQLYVNWSETLTAAKWNALVNELNILKNQNASIFSWSWLDVIYCHMSWTTSNPASSRITKSFTAANCWWKLPDDNYLPIIKNIWPWWWIVTLELLKPWQTWYPWVSWRQTNANTDWTASAYYLKVK